MSTAVATSSPPSPHTSPLAFAHPSSSSPRPSLASSPRHRSPAASRPFPRLYSANSPSPRKPFNAPSSSHASQHSAQHSQQQQQHFVESGPVAQALQGYTSRGTQYSPDGFPPTTSRKVAADAGRRPQAEPTTTRKRKEAVSSESSSESMSSATNASPGAYRPSTVLLQPDEPKPRVDPGRASEKSHEASGSEPEPQEARSTHGHSAAPKRSRPDPGSLQTMPLKYETANPKDLGILISNMLMELIRINDRIPLRDGRLTRFHSRAPPGISVSDYLQRLIQHATLSPPILLSMVYYIDRLCTMYPAFTINSLTVHRFLITAATVAAKGLSDSFWTNPTYARIGGIPVSELATLELEFLQRVQWKIVPKPEVLVDYYASLVERTEGYTLEASSSGSDSTSLDESDGPSKSSDGRSNSKEDEEMGG